LTELAADRLPRNVETCHELIEQLAAENRQLQSRVEWLARKLFGRSSERRADGELEFFGDAWDPAKNASRPETHNGPAPEAKSADARRAGGGRRKLPADMPRRRLVHDVEQAAKICNGCGREKTCIGEQITEQLEYVPASTFVIEHVQLKYACPCCKEGVVQAEKPPQPIEKCMAGPGLLAHVIVGKYSEHLPLYRQEAMLARHGVQLSRALLCQWAMAAAEALEPVVRAMRREILESGVIATDDTPVDVHTKQGNHQGRLWVYLGDSLHPYTIYDFSWTRAGEFPRKFLDGFTGTLLADAFSGYDALFKSDPRQPEKTVLIEAGCNAHARRYFHEAAAEAPALVARILRLYRRLWAVEREAKEKWPALREPAPDPSALAEAVAGRLELRKRRSRPVMKAMKKIMEILRRRDEVLPKSGLGKAIGYALGNWAALTRLLHDGFVEVDNNASERALRGVCLGRKNWLHLGSRRGGRAAAVLFSLIQSARRHHLDPFVYLRDLLARIPTHPQSRIHELFPNRWKAQAEPAAEPPNAAPPAPAQATK